MFKKVDSKVNLVKLEEKTLSFWKKNKIFVPSKIIKINISLVSD